MRSSPAVAAAAVSVALACSPAAEPPTEATPDPEATAAVELTLPEGFTAEVFAEVGRGARHLVVDDQGDVYVRMNNTEQGGGVIALRDTDGDGRADERQAFAASEGSGVRLRDGYLYASSWVDVVRWPLGPDDLGPAGEPETIVSDFPEQSSHKVKTFDFDGEGRMYVEVGAPSNACMEEARTAGSPGLDPCPQLERHAGVWRFSADQAGQTQDDGLRFVRGTRHLVALSWNASTDSLYAVQHGRDALDTLWPDAFEAEQNAELPAEEFLSLSEGDEYGWPYCYYDPFQEKRVLAPEYGGDGETQGRCADLKGPILTFPAHTAPNALLFYDGEQFPESYRGGAFVAFHGSWNRAPLPQKGYYVAFVPMTDGTPSGEWSVFADGFGGPGEIASPRDAVHRPCGLAVAPDGSLYVSDSVKGTIWRIRYTG